MRIPGTSNRYDVSITPEINGDLNNDRMAVVVPCDVKSCEKYCSRIHTWIMIKLVMWVNKMIILLDLWVSRCVGMENIGNWETRMPNHQINVLTTIINAIMVQSLYRNSDFIHTIIMYSPHCKFEFRINR